MKRKEKIERVREVTQILCAPRIGDRVRVLECAIPGHRVLKAPCYALMDGMVGTERVITKTMMYSFSKDDHEIPIWLTRGVRDPQFRPFVWWLTRHQFEIIDG